MKKFGNKRQYCIVRTTNGGFVRVIDSSFDAKIAVRKLETLQKKDRFGFCYYIVPVTVPVYYFE